MTDTPYAPPPRRKKTAPMTWPAFVVAALVAAALAAIYALRAPSLPLEAELGPALWPIFNASLVPTVVLTLGTWCLLYFGFVRWRNDERGPLYFNLLLAVSFATLILTPLARHQVEVFQAGDIKGLEADMTKAAAFAKADEAQAKAPLTAALRAAAEVLTLDPPVLASAADRRDARAKVDAARKASKAYHEAYAARHARDRAAFAQAIAGRRVSAEIAREGMIEYDRIAEGKRLRAERDFEHEQALFDTVDSGIAALSRAPWRVEGSNLMFASRADAETFSLRYDEAAILRRKLERRVGASQLEFIGER